MMEVDSDFCAQIGFRCNSQMLAFVFFSDSRSCRKRLCVGFLCLIASTLLPAALAQLGNAKNSSDTSSPAASSDPSRPKYSTEVKVVSLLATVRDKHGQIINNLSKDDFSLEEDG